LEAGRTYEALRTARRSRARVPRRLDIEARIERLSGPARARFQAATTRYLQVRQRCDEEGREDLGQSVLRQAEMRKALLERCSGAEEDLERALAGLVPEAGPGGTPATADPELFRGPAADEVILAYHPLPEGWVAFAADVVGVEAHRFTLPPKPWTDSDLAARLLAPFAARLQRAKRVRLLPYGALDAVEFRSCHSRESRWSRAPVVYGLDLAQAPQGGGSGRNAVVVADPEGNLPHACEEGGRLSEITGRWLGGAALGGR
jgi:hypothetical protein